jgi:SPP1 family phage portal protein
MAIELTAADILKIWDNSAADRTIQAARSEYYEGDQNILDETEERYDGQSHNLVVTNWVCYVVGKHVGFITSKPIRYTPIEGQDEAALVNLSEIYRYNYLNATDVEHLKNAILAGYGVEVHSYDGEQVIITGYSPENWAFLEDENGVILAAVYRATLATGTFWQGAILSSPVDVYTCYTDAEIITLQGEQRPASAVVQGVPIDTPGASKTTGLTEVARVPHQYGRVPVIRIAVSNNLEPFIDDAFISQQDVFNQTRSRNADDVEYNVDSLLKITGYPPDAMVEEDANGDTYADKMRQNRMLLLKEGGDASFLTKGNEFSKVEFDLKISRDAIHMMGAVADTEAIAGATGSTSGIALKLKLQPQIDQAGVFTSYFEQGIRDRIDLINIIWGIKGLPLLEQFDVSFSLQIPVNEIEIWQGITYLDPYLSRDDILKLIPSVEDPVAAAERKQKELDASVPTLDMFRPPQDEHVVNDEEQVTNNEETTNA